MTQLDVQMDALQMDALLVTQISASVCAAGAVWLSLLWGRRLHARTVTARQIRARADALLLLATSSSEGPAAAEPPFEMALLHRLVGWGQRLRRYGWFRAALDFYEPLVGHGRLEPYLVQANLERTFTLGDLAAARLALTLAALALSALMLPDLGRALQFAMLGAAAAWVIPSYLVTTHAEKRLEESRRALPEALDIITIGLEAGGGGGFEHVMQFYVEGFPGPLAEEFEKSLHYVRAGRGRAAALQSMAERCPAPEITSFANAVIQADRFGTPIGATLRIQSNIMKTTRRQHVEEKSQKLTTYLLLPTMLYIVALLIVLVGPMLLQMTQSGLF